MAATFVTKKCSYIIKLYKVIDFVANYFKQVEIVPLNKWAYQHGFIVVYCSKYGIKDGYQWANHNILSAFIWNWKNVA